MPSHQRYPRAVDLAQMAHCSVCGYTDPVVDEGGDTECCGRRECPGMGPEAQDVCCQALQDRVDHEAVYGTPASPLSVKSRTRPTSAPSTRIHETRDLHNGNGSANLVSHQGAAAPTTTDTQEPAMAIPATTPAGTRVTTAQGITGTTTGTPALTPSGHVVSVSYDPEFAHLSPCGGADHDVTELDAAPAAAPAERPATGWSRHHSSDVYHGYAVMAADKGRVWHLSRHNDEAVCGATVDRYIDVERAAELTGLCTRCSRYLDRTGDYAAPAAAAPQAPATEPAPVAPAAAPAPARKAARAALGAASAPGWELLYDKPKAGAEVGRRYVDGRPQFSLICKAHGHVHELERLADEGKVRKAGGWCPSC
ncbi:hypothetical protein [Streptomyces longwoodensis]|uniref:hypothetical protein n=1 Tax=Streptomyces longwoodensis TaxID=68231 RepID=UPI0036FC4D96